MNTMTNNQIERLAELQRYNSSQLTRDEIRERSKLYKMTPEYKARELQRELARDHWAGFETDFSDKCFNRRAF